LSIVAIVPARGGSKGIINKNLQEISGKSLVEITVSYALRTQLCTRVIVSTDSEAIASKFLKNCSAGTFQALSCNSFVPGEAGVLVHRRDAIHATSKARTGDLVLDILSHYKEQDFDKVLLLQPTSPFRSRDELSRMMEDIDLVGAGSCISAKRFDSPHPDKKIKITNGKLVLDHDTIQMTTSPRQELGEYYVFDGGFYVARVDHFMQEGTFIDENTLVYVREGKWTINIDSNEDLDFARFVAERNPWMLEQ